ncbi:hypothetical protein KZX15_11245 [Micrococcus luteus]|nr:MULTISPECIES: hypothetical protein [Micrococcus]MCK6214920.1 hypothetical protein [Micrococcus luteus]MCO0634105.1 hypothetical protein [Micrococcus yunnanensis]WHM15851.1 hypothetical protein QL063_07290 [Micrococcus yunnanensis]
MSTPPPVRAAISLRVSQNSEMDGLAIDDQRGDCIAEAERRGWPVKPYST